MLVEIWTDSGQISTILGITRAHLDPQKLVLGKMKELQKLRERWVYSYVDRDLVLRDSAGKFFQTTLAKHRCDRCECGPGRPNSVKLRRRAESARGFQAMSQLAANGRRCGDGRTFPRKQMSSNFAARVQRPARRRPNRQVTFSRPPLRALWGCLLREFLSS